MWRLAGKHIGLAKRGECHFCSQLSVSPWLVPRLGRQPWCCNRQCRAVMPHLAIKDVDDSIFLHTGSGTVDQNGEPRSDQCMPAP